MVEDNDPLVGRVIADKYKLERLVGQGAMGRVYRAVQQPIDKVVALKVMHAALGTDPLARGRFMREAKAASKIDHPNSVQVFDFGTLDDGTLFIVMEFVRGRDLAQRLTLETRLSGTEAVGVMTQVLSALASAHDAGIIHRDLKPENIMLVPRPDGEQGELVKVADFGIAKLVQGEGGEKLTTTGLVAGTPAYMSPENGQGRPVDARSDLYTCGVILYELVTGRLPLLADNALAVVVKHIVEMPAPPSKWMPGIEPALEEVIMRCLQKDPDARYQDARGLRAALKAAVTGVSDSAPSLVASSSPRIGIKAPLLATAEAPAHSDSLQPMPETFRTEATMAPVATTTARPTPVLGTASGTSGKRRSAVIVAVAALAVVVAAGVVVPKLRAPSERTTASLPTLSPTTAPTPSEVPETARPAMVVAAPTPVLTVPTAPVEAALPGVPAHRERNPHRERPAAAQPTAATAQAAPTPTPPQAAPPAPAPTTTPAETQATAQPAPTPRPATPEPAQPTLAAAVTPPPPRPLRSVASQATVVTVTSGASRAAFNSPTAASARALASCVFQRAGQTHPEFVSPVTVTVIITVRDQHFDHAQVIGLPLFASSCNTAVRSGFEDTLPASDDAEYEVVFRAALTPER